MTFWCLIFFKTYIIIGTTCSSNVCFILCSVDKSSHFPQKRKCHHSKHVKMACFRQLFLTRRIYTRCPVLLRYRFQISIIFFWRHFLTIRCGEPLRCEMSNYAEFQVDEVAVLSVLQPNQLPILWLPPLAMLNVANLWHLTLF